MSRTKPTPLEAAILKVACSRCGSGQGHWCETGHYWGGARRPAGQLHVLRSYNATSAGFLPLAEEPADQPTAAREQRVPHDFVRDEDRQGEPREGLACGWCGVTEAEMEAAGGRLDLCGFLPSERWDEGS